MASKPLVATASGDWQKIRQKTAEPSITEVQVDTSKLPLTDVNGEQVLRMYWLDAFEGEGSHGDTVYLFGKVACLVTE